jgi:hypothetical protein
MYDELTEIEGTDCPLSSANSKRSEVEALMRLHGYTFQQAFDLVNLTEEEFYSSNISPQSKIEYLPTPEMIKEMCEEIRANRPIQDDPEFDLRYDDIDESLLY